MSHDRAGDTSRRSGNSPAIVLSRNEAVRGDFPRIKAAPDCTDGSQRVNVVSNACLSVTRAVLESNNKRMWEFYWQGFRVSAPVADFGFFGKLERHEYTLGIGDDLVADLEVTQHLNSRGVWENKSYRVLKVHDVIHQGRTERMDL